MILDKGKRQFKKLTKCNVSKKGTKGVSENNFPLFDAPYNMFYVFLQSQNSK